MRKTVFLKRITKKVSDTNVEYIDDDRVRAGEVWVYTIVAAQNKTSAFTKLQIGIKDDGNFLPFKQHDTVSAGSVKNLENTLIVTEGNKLSVAFYGCTAGDIIEIYLNGYVERYG